jgi:3-oxoacyl-[acyl-carrier-protein] synthase II
MREPVQALVDQHPDLRLGLVVATSHGESGALSVLAEEHTLGRPGDDLAEAGRAVLADQLLPAVWEGLGHRLPGTTVAAACASAIVATGIAYNRLRHGLYDACLVVVVDALSRLAYAGFRQIGAMSALGCRPFDSVRDGTTIGEAAVGFMLTRSPGPLSHSDAPAITGLAISCDARHPVEPTVDGIISVIRQALEEAGLAPEDVVAVIWHGSGTIQNDSAEAQAAQTVFGAAQPPGTATKGSFGHAMGASAGLSILTACEMLHTGLLPPIHQLDTLDAPWLDLVTHAPRRVRPGPVLVVALGFGGINAAVVLVPPERMG